MGTIYRRGDIWWVKYYIDGRPIRESTGTTKETEARRFLKQREGAAAEGRPILPRTGRLRIAELLENFVNDYRTNEKRSLDKAIVSARRLSAAFGHRRAVSLTTADIRAYVAGRQENGAANATINRELAALKRSYKLAVADGTLHRVPHIPLLAEHNIRKGFYRDTDLDGLLRVLPPYLIPVLQFGVFSGWRKQEVLGLRWTDVDLDQGIVRLEPGTSKEEEGRTLHLSSELLELLRKQRAAATALERERQIIIPWVFHRNGQQIKSFRRAWLTACRKVGIPGRFFHDLRRTAIRNMVRAGIPERVAMQMAGHKTRHIFDRYNIVSEGDLREAAQKLSASRAQFRAQSPKPRIERTR